MAALGIGAWITLTVILSVFIILAFTDLPADFVFLGGMTALLVSGVLTFDETFSGVSSNTVVVIAVLFIVVTGMVATGALRWVTDHLMGLPRSYPMALIKLMMPVAALSAFLSNSTVVAMFVKVVRMWSRKLGIPASKLLIPLSYAAGMGGVCTLIGTPPNLIISEMYAADTGVSLGIFSIFIPGAFCLAVGVVSVVAMRSLLPERRSGGARGDIAQEHLMEMRVTPDNPCVGMTLRESGLATSEDGKVIELTRFDREIVSPVSDDEFLFGGDRILMAGNRERLEMLCSRYRFLDADLDVPAGPRTAVAACIMTVMVLLSVLGIVPLAGSCLLAAMAMLLTRCCSVSQVRGNIDWGILVVLSASATFSIAIEKTGLAEAAASVMLGVSGGDPLILLAVICFLGTFVTEFISNTACGAMLYPIAYSAAISMGVSPLPFVMGLMVAVSSSFATPIGSPTHLLVYNAGGYRFADFVRIGIPMNLIILAANIFIVTLLFPF